MTERERFLDQIQNKTNLQYWLFEGQWHRVDHETICKIDSSKPIAGLACYRNGEVLYRFGRIQHLPDGVTFLIEPRPNADRMRFERKLIRNGKGGALIEHSATADQTKDPRFYYSTRITNLSANRIRVIKFAPFLKGIMRIKTKSNTGYYSAEQFQSWYSINNPDGWIAPRNSVCDPDNYAHAKGVWAFFFENDLGDCFIATAPLINKSAK